MSANLKLAVPFFNVSDMARSVAFYTEGLGFEIKIRWEPEGVLRWCWIERGPVALMLQSYQPPAGHPQKPPLEKPGEGISISFQCEDAIALYHEIVGRGLEPERPFVGNSLWTFSLRDPDGFVLEFASPTNVAEGTELAL
jgi:catechol 2,3-dioxygenase-like lactoylglutathione lyase family enzyme